MKLALVAGAIAVTALGAARVAREQAKQEAIEEVAVPYAPSTGAAPFISLGYRELLADLLFVRMAGYFGGPDSDSERIASLAEAIVTVDPHFRRVYEWAAIAITGAHHGVTTKAQLRAIRLLELGAAAYPTDWKLPNRAGQIYLVDLQTTDPAQRRIWDDAGARLLEASIRKPNAPAEAAMTVAFLRSKLGQRQRAIDGLREMLLLTSDRAARARILEKLSSLTHDDAGELAAEILEERRRFESEWVDHRPAVTPSMYVLVGPRIAPGFDLGDLATGGRELLADPLEHQ